MSIYYSSLLINTRIFGEASNTTVFHRKKGGKKRPTWLHCSREVTAHMDLGAEIPLNSRNCVSNALNMVLRKVT